MYSQSRVGGRDLGLQEDGRIRLVPSPAACRGILLAVIRRGGRSEVT